MRGVEHVALLAGNEWPGNCCEPGLCTGSSTFSRTCPVLNTHSNHFPCCISFLLYYCLLNIRYILNKIINPYIRSCCCPTHTPSTLTDSGKVNGFLLPIPTTHYVTVICDCSSIWELWGVNTQFVMGRRW